jgi:hypothetical protein
MQIKTITEKDIDILEQMLAQNPEYIEIDFEFIKQKSARIISPNDKPKKKKNLELELKANNPKPVLNLNLKSQNTKVIIFVGLQARNLNYRKLRSIIKHVRAYNPFAIKLTAQPINDLQNNNLIRLLVSKTQNEHLILEIEGRYKEFWQTNKVALGSLLLG